MIEFENITTPILFITFNRPEITRTTFDVIRNLKPTKLYLVSDGPRNQNEKYLVEETRKLLEKIDWNCQVYKKYSDINLGCKNSVEQAIDWVFEFEDRAIILEDDCCPSYTWFRFAQNMLEYYKDNKNIMTITGTRYNPDIEIKNYFLSQYNICWGWATWRRSWSLYDREMKRFEIKKSDWILSIGQGKREFREYWASCFDYAKNDPNSNTWAYKWTYSCWINQGLTIVPPANLIENIGINSGTHECKDSKHFHRPAIEISRHFNKISELELRNDYDSWVTKNIYRINMRNYIIRKIKEWLKKIEKSIF